MKVNFFNGLMMYEGTPQQLKELIAILPDMSKKLTTLQIDINEALYKHAQNMKALGPNPQPLGQGPPPGMLQ